MKNIWYDLPGVYNSEQAARVKKVLEGHGISQLVVQYGGYGADNQVITVGCEDNSDCETENDIQEWVVFLLANEVK